MMQTPDPSANYVIGTEYGTLLGRAVVVQASNGAELCRCVFEIPTRRQLCANSLYL